MRWSSEALGQSIVELALTLPIAAYVLLGGADIARAYAAQLAVQNGARAGAEAAAVDYSPTVSEAASRAIDEMDRTPGLDASSASVTVTFAGADETATCLDPPTVAVPCYVTVRVVYVWRTLTPWPLVPNTFTFDRTTTMRLFAAPG